ncbi:hypothetical protein [Halostagnicola sp. A-GB9-2]|uniref:DUF7344 domain-containing protein n=1 Tax=Halostagnicola sp. A-GB9-2 TaxID=3048066 RepID=UPI0024C0284B|nr:hypothetical protein [Halostagnicola sp. A-GB9-2]MDJ1432545.1 hypothetical protein [Halostagnicola sp. A-GB9-2]
MKTDTTDVEHRSGDVPLPTNTIFDLLLDQRRRYVLYYLSRRLGAVSIEELTEAIELREGTQRSDSLERISTGLHHNHLPKLVDANVVKYDPTTERVERLPAASKLDPYLELAAIDDLSQRARCS